ncbi:MAG: AGE family epimerase/isomerase [Fusobacteriota bacterium]
MKKWSLKLMLVVIVLIVVGCSFNQDGEKKIKTDPIKVKDELSQNGESELNYDPEIMQGETWKKHLVEDLLPFWELDSSLGEPVGNFPTYRTFDGDEVYEPRHPRMIARQIYFYSMTYLMTGQEKYLEYAKAGTNWLIDHAWDKENGGWYWVIDKNGDAFTMEQIKESEPDTGFKEGQYGKFAQDASYCAMGMAAYYFVTRDTEVEEYIYKTRDLIMDKYWVESENILLDGFNYDFTEEIDQEGGGYELVSLLDQINAYMMLSQPVLSTEARQEQFLNDMRVFADSMIENYYKNGIFWGQMDNIGAFNTRHVDFGHTLKSYWMLHQLDKRLDDNPYQDLVNNNVDKWIDLAYQDEYGKWADKMTSYDSVNYKNSQWWIYAEANQLTATLNMESGEYTDKLKKTMSNWMELVDPKYGSINYSIKPDGSWWNDGNADDWKTDWWKNGFHEAEHALVMYILGNDLENKDVELYFAIEDENTDTFIAKPYIYDGTETSREEIEDIAVDGKNYKKVKVSFKEIN